MKVTLVLYCFDAAEFVCKTIEKPHILQENMFIAFTNLMVRVERIVWAEDLQETVVCCGLILKATEGSLEGSRLVFSFGKIPQDLWRPKEYRGWTIHAADTRWDSILSPLIDVVAIDEDYQSSSGED